MAWSRTISVNQPHRLGLAVALARLSAMLATLGQNPSVSLIDLSWSDNRAVFTLSVYGITVHGRAEVAADHVSVNTDPLPLITLPFLSWVQSRIVAKLAEVLK